MEFLSFVGLVSIIALLFYVIYWGATNLKFKNPIKSYIRKQVLTYLKELQDDTM